MGGRLANEAVHRSGHPSLPAQVACNLGTSPLREALRALSHLVVDVETVSDAALTAIEMRGLTLLDAAGSPVVFLALRYRPPAEEDA